MPQGLEETVPSIRLALAKGLSMLVSGQPGTPAAVDDSAVLARETLRELYDDHDSVTGVIAPRGGQHVGFEDTYTFGVALTPDTDASCAPPALVIGTDSTRHDALWDGVNPGGAMVPSRRLESLSFSKKLVSHIGTIKFFIYHYNLEKATALPV